MKKLYTFLDENRDIFAQVRAENHDRAIELTGAWSGRQAVFSDDFYFEDINE